MSWTVDNPGPLIAFSGSRKFTDAALVEHVFDRLLLRWRWMLVRVGDAKAGLDPMVAQEATRRGISLDVQECWWPPWPSTKAQRWEAAHERNGRVIQDADLLVAFYADGAKTSGTTDAITQAKKRGIVVYVYHERHWDTLYRRTEMSDSGHPQVPNELPVGSVMKHGSAATA